MLPGQSGYCGLRMNLKGSLKERAKRGSGFMHMYMDSLPTNCCASWFCQGSEKKGYNLAVFLYGCNFNCLYCQNSSHKNILDAPLVTEEELVRKALHPQVRCICFFGGSPEPQFPFVLRAAQQILDESGGSKHICWEWNGCGRENLVLKAAELSARTRGTVKFDLKVYHSHLSYALCGVSNKRSFENFYSVHRIFPQRNMLTATTLLVPWYVDAAEIKSIASFIAKMDSHIPYSLLVFHPDFYMADLPVTPREQVDECYGIAQRYLKRVNMGNRALLMG
jgi:pyruvate formate lyase activating enzyme